MHCIAARIVGARSDEMDKNKEPHERQTVLEVHAASLQSVHPVLGVLTDLNGVWDFFYSTWVATASVLSERLTGEMDWRCSNLP